MHLGPPSIERCRDQNWTVAIQPKASSGKDMNMMLSDSSCLWSLKNSHKIVLFPIRPIQSTTCPFSSYWKCRWQSVTWQRRLGRFGLLFGDAESSCRRHTALGIQWLQWPSAVGSRWCHNVLHCWILSTKTISEYSQANSDLWHLWLWTPELMKEMSICLENRPLHGHSLFSPGFSILFPTHGSLNVPMFHITQPLYGL